MKKLFVLVDFDDVLNNETTQNLASTLFLQPIPEELYRGDRETWELRWTWVDPTNVAALQKLHTGLLDLINANLHDYVITYIVSSTWRRSFFPQTLTAILRSYGWRGAFFGETSLALGTNGRDKPRHNEIAEFVQRELEREEQPIFLILDDKSGIREELQDVSAICFHLQTQETTGLTHQDVEAALAWLKGIHA
jgi:hypothetical protein